MREERDVAMRWTRGWAALGLAVLLLASEGALAQDTCRQWREEHHDLSVTVVRLYLTGGGRHALDEALFELLQREAYLTSCATSLVRARDRLVGWRLVGRSADEYAAAVVDTVLVRAGFPGHLRDYLGADAEGAALALRGHAPGE